MDKLLTELGAGTRFRARVLAETSPEFARLALAGERLGTPVDIGQVLRAMRLRRQLTQAELARAISMAQSSIAKWETGASIPDVQVIHALCFALGASAEEVAALSCARPAEPSIDSLERSLFRASQPPLELREVILLGLEADSWQAATRDASVDLFLCDARAERAKLYLQNGRLTEVEEPARAALRLAKTTDSKQVATVAVWALFELARRRSRVDTVIELLESWVEAVGSPSHRGWMLSMMGLACAGEGRHNDAVRCAEQSIELAAHSGPGEIRNRILDLAEIHLLMGNEDEALETLNREDPEEAAVARQEHGDFSGMKTRARAILACQLLPSDELMESLRSAVRALPTVDYVRDLANIERSYARVSAGRLA